ncbi:hypothetical protein Tco_0469458 [Tanacetum coccineum]
MVTYTEVSSPFADLSDIGSPGVDGPPVMPEDPYAYVVDSFLAPPSPDYVPGPEEPEQAPPLPDFVPEPFYPEFMPPKDEVLPAEEKPLPAAASLTADSPGYVPESDPEEEPEEDHDEDPEEDPVDYPANGGDDGHDEDESSDDDEDDGVDIEEHEEEEEHPALVDSTAVAFPAVKHAPSAEETEPFETNESAATLLPHPAYRVTARISIRDEPPTPFWSDTDVARLLAMPTPPPSPLSLWSSPLPQIPSPPLPLILSPLPVSSPFLVSPPLPLAPPPLPISPTYPLGNRAAMIRLRAEVPSTSHSPPPHIILSHTKADTPPSGTPPSRTPPLLPIPAPTSSPSLLLPSADYGADRPEDEMLVDMPGVPATNDTELGQRMTNFATRVRQDTDEIYVRLDDEQTEQQLMDGRLNMLYKDRHAHARTALLMEREARMSREAWGRSMDASNLARSEVTITELLAADCRRQAQFIEALKLL